MNSKKELPADTDLEILLTQTARILYEYVLIQNDIKKLHTVDLLFDAFRAITNDYCHDHIDRLFGGDLALNLSIWIGFKHDMLSSASEKDKGLVEDYGNSVIEMIEDLENLLGITPYLDETA